MKEAVKAAALRSFAGYLKIIDERYTKQLLHPLHAVAYYLNLKYQYKHGLGTKADLLKSLQDVIEKLEPKGDLQAIALKEVKWYRDSISSFNRNAAVVGRQNTLPEQNKEHYSDPIDLSDIFCKEGEEDPLFEWVKDVGEPLLDEVGGRPSSQIAQQMGVDIDEYMTTQSQGRDIDWSSLSSEAAPPSLSGGGDRGEDDNDDGGNESAQPGGGASGGDVGSVGGGSENIEMSPFTVEQNFDHTTQDEDHASRQAPRDQTYRRRRYKLMEVDESGHPIQNTDVGPMTATMDSLSIGSGRRDTSSSALYGVLILTKMVRPMDTFWEYMVEIFDKRMKCKFCGDIISGTITRAKYHLTKMPNRDVKPCPNVPEAVFASAKMVMGEAEMKKQKLTEGSSSTTACNPMGVVQLIDNFTNKKGMTSHCYRIAYRSMERSLTDEEINQLQWNVREQVQSKLKVVLR
ncbi:hypothetical protein HHK36_004658 [Tetracentron sinense]|uniref:BED-type domain-containing protein n=2 Tax=Magnoliopsida TaxID=3398 RepID=A0A834ZN50_TETSI|nr:hypothetical protein HHK36_004658 [Tetracentron sinense]